MEIVYSWGIGHPVDRKQKPLAASPAALVGPPQIPGVITRAIDATTTPSGEAGKIIRPEDVATRLRSRDQHLPGSGPAILLHQRARRPDSSETGRPGNRDIDVRLSCACHYVTRTLGVDGCGLGLFGLGLGRALGLVLGLVLGSVIRCRGCIRCRSCLRCSCRQAVITASRFFLVI